MEKSDVIVERAVPGKPHAGKVLAAIQAHADDIPLFCGGTMAKLIKEGYTAYLIQTTNDEKCGPTTSIGKTVLSNEEEVDALAKVLGFKQVFNLGYRNHRQDESPPVELRARLVFLFRLLRVDTIFTFNPWGHNERNVDHSILGRAVETVCWMAGGDKDYPEHFVAGLEPHGVSERYYWVARHGQPHNRVVDISDVIEKKVEAISVNKSQGPGGSQGCQLRDRLAAQGRHLPELVGDDETIDRAYIRRFVLEEDRELGRKYGLDYAERFYYVASEPFYDTDSGPSKSPKVRDYIAKHAVPIE